MMSGQIEADGRQVGSDTPSSSGLEPERPSDETCSGLRGSSTTPSVSMCPQFNLLPHFRDGQVSETHKTIANWGLPHFLYVSMLLPGNSFLVLKVKQSPDSYYKLYKVQEITEWKGKSN